MPVLIQDNLFWAGRLKKLKVLQGSITDLSMLMVDNCDYNTAGERMEEGSESADGDVDTNMDASSATGNGLLLVFLFVA